MVVPALQGRAAIDLFERVSFDARFLALLGGEAPRLYDTKGDGAFKAVASLAVARLHSRTTPQFWIDAGLGVGHLISLQQNFSDESPPLRGRAGLAALLGTGVRVTAKSWLFGANLSWVHWTQAEHAEASCCNAPAQSGLSTSALLLMLTAGHSFAP